MVCRMVELQYVVHRIANGAVDRVGSTLQRARVDVQCPNGTVRRNVHGGPAVAAIERLVVIDQIAAKALAIVRRNIRIDIAGRIRSRS